MNSGCANTVWPWVARRCSRALFIVYRQGRIQIHNHLTAGADDVQDLVALTQAQGAPHGLQNRGLVKIGERGFAFKGGGHGDFWCGRSCAVTAMQLPCLCCCNCIVFDGVWLIRGVEASPYLQNPNHNLAGIFLAIFNSDDDLAFCLASVRRTAPSSIKTYVYLVGVGRYFLIYFKKYHPKKTARHGHRIRST